MTTEMMLSENHLKHMQEDYSKIDSLYSQIVTTLQESIGKKVTVNS